MLILLTERESRGSIASATFIPLEKQKYPINLHRPLAENTTTVDVSTTGPGPDFSGLGQTGGGQSGLQGKDAQELARDLLAAVSRQQQQQQHADGDGAGAGSSGGVESGAGTRRVLTPDTPRMRSSIACVRCRRSKVKCLNEGVNTPCRACKVAGRDCIYPSPASREQSHVRDENVDRTGDNGLASPGVSRRL